MTFSTSQTWPDEKGNRGSGYFELGYEDVDGLELRLVLGHPVVWCRRNGCEAEYPIGTVQKMVRDHGV